MKVRRIWQGSCGLQTVSVAQVEVVEVDVKLEVYKVRKLL